MQIQQIELTAAAARQITGGTSFLPGYPTSIEECLKRLQQQIIDDQIRRFLRK